MKLLISAKDTIEENIIKLQEDKREIINSVISDDSLNINNISKLTNEEILITLNKDYSL